MGQSGRHCKREIARAQIRSAREKRARRARAQAVGWRWGWVSRAKEASIRGRSDAQTAGRPTKAVTLSLLKRKDVGGGEG